MLPALPNDKLLMQKLMPSYNVLSNIGRRQAHGQPLYAVSGIQRTAAEGFLQVCCSCAPTTRPAPPAGRHNVQPPHSVCHGWNHLHTHQIVSCCVQNMRQYLTGLTANLAKHTITDVKLDQRISVLLKDSFIESFAPRERQFVRQFVVRTCPVSILRPHVVILCVRMHGCVHPLPVYPEHLCCDAGTSA